MDLRGCSLGSCIVCPPLLADSLVDSRACLLLQRLSMFDILILLGSSAHSLHPCCLADVVGTVGKTQGMGHD